MTTDQPVGTLILSRPSGRFFMTRNSDQTRENILAAAHHVLRTLGVRSLTLDKVAVEAGVSKGGLIHHFHSKDDLLIAMQRQVFELAEAELHRQLELEPSDGRKGRFVRAFLRCNLNMIQRGIPGQFAGVLELAIAAPHVFGTERSYFRDVQRAVEADGGDPVLFLIIASASDYIWLQVLLGVLEPHDPLIQQVHDRLIGMTY